MEADAKTACVLLFNDGWNPDWRVRVDGAKSALLRCNYIMRGVRLTAGSHTVRFHFEPPIWPLYFSLAGIGLGAVIWGMLLAAPLLQTRERIPKQRGCASAPKEPRRLAGSSAPT
jgi:uncharacterized membrane protein YfhO